jgi:hypothetical protein
MAALSADRRVALMRCSVDGVGVRPDLFVVAPIVVIMSVMCRAVSSLSRIRPRCGIRCRSTCTSYERSVVGRIFVRVVSQYRSQRCIVQPSAVAVSPSPSNASRAAIASRRVG